MQASYFVRARKNGTTIRLPIFDVPELDKPVRDSAFASKAHLERHGWEGVKVLGPDYRPLQDG